MVKDIVNIFVIVTSAILITFVFSGILYAPFYYMGEYSCDSYGERVGLKTDYSLINGCMVEVDGTWKPSKNTVEIKNGR